MLLNVPHTPAVTLTTCVSKCHACKNNADTDPSIIPRDVAKRKWDQVVMFMFLCALFPFLHAFLGIGGEQDEIRPVNDTSRERLNESPGKNTSGIVPRRNQLLAKDIHAGDPVGDITQLAHASTASVPQDAFPDATSPISYSEEMASALTSAAAFEQTPGPSAPFWFQENKGAGGTPYDALHLDFSSMDYTRQNQLNTARP